MWRLREEEIVLGLCLVMIIELGNPPASSIISPEVGLEDGPHSRTIAAILALER